MGVKFREFFLLREIKWILAYFGAADSAVLKKGWRKCEGLLIREVQGVGETADSIGNANTNKNKDFSKYNKDFSKKEQRF